MRSLLNVDEVTIVLCQLLVMIVKIYLIYVHVFYLLNLRLLPVQIKAISSSVYFSFRKSSFHFLLHRLHHLYTISIFNFYVSLFRQHYFSLVICWILSWRQSYHRCTIAFCFSNLTEVHIVIHRKSWRIA